MILHTPCSKSWQLLISGGFALKCMVGVNNETKPMECSGSWEKVDCNCNEKILDFLNRFCQLLHIYEILNSLLCTGAGGYEDEAWRWVWSSEGDLSFFLGQPHQAIHNTWSPQTVPFVYHCICQKLLFERVSLNIANVHAIWNHSHKNSVEVASVLGFHCHIIPNHVMSCYYCQTTCNCARIQILYSFQANLTTDLTGTIEMVKKKLGGAIDALKNSLPNNDNGRKRSFWILPVFVFNSKCWTICERTNLIIEILVDGILPAAERIVVQSCSRNLQALTRAEPSQEVRGGSRRTWTRGRTRAWGWLLLCQEVIEWNNSKVLPPQG